MVEIGKYNVLTVIDELDFGMILDGGEVQRILLPRRYVPNGCVVGTELEVFIYLDSEDRIIATTEMPNATVGEFACMQVTSVNKVGAFLDWGLMKDLLVPFREQKTTMQEGKWYVVYVYYDKESGRIAATAKIDKYLDNTLPQYERGQEVDIMIAAETEIGYKVIINNEHWGMVYHNQVFKPIQKGDRMKGYVKLIREDDKIDINLTPFGFDKAATLTDVILEKLAENNGSLPFNDKSSSESIQEQFQCSKKAFKMAIGSLYKQKKIVIADNGIKLA